MERLHRTTGHEENYLHGYIEAAIKLVGDKRMFEKPDTLMLPILHNARHDVELSLKFATGRLAAAGLVPAPQRHSHNIKACWDRLHDADLGDEKLSQTIKEMKPLSTVFRASRGRALDRQGRLLKGVHGPPAHGPSGRSTLSISLTLLYETERLLPRPPGAPVPTKERRACLTLYCYCADCPGDSNGDCILLRILIRFGVI